MRFILKWIRRWRIILWMCLLIISIRLNRGVCCFEDDRSKCCRLDIWMYRKLAGLLWMCLWIYCHQCISLCLGRGGGLSCRISLGKMLCYYLRVRQVMDWMMIWLFPFSLWLLLFDIIIFVIFIEDLVIIL